MNSLDIQIRNETVKIKRDFSILLNGAEKQKPVRAHHLKIEQKSQFGIEIELFGILITWVPIEENIRINVEPIFSDQTLGRSFQNSTQNSSRYDVTDDVIIMSHISNASQFSEAPRSEVSGLAVTSGH